MERPTPILIMEALEFAHRFFPVPSSVLPPNWASITFEDCALGDHLLEIRVAEKLTRIVNAHNVAPGYKLSGLSDKPAMEVGGVDESKVHALEAAFVKTEEAPILGSPRWIDQLVSVEIMRQIDPFDNRDDAQAAERKQARREITADAEKIFRLQHRTALFMLLVIGRRFRFIRWDRSGAIVTPAVDYVAQPKVLCDLLWQMALQSDEQLGMDPSAARLHPDDEEYKLMDEFAVRDATDLWSNECMVPMEDLSEEPMVFQYVRLSFRASLHRRWPRYRLEVPSGSKTRSFLVGKPMSYKDGMVSRGSRGYVALDVKTKEFVWLKDTWRVYDELPTPEGSTLSRLNEKEVRSVPTLVCHGDIRNQTTLSPQVWEEQNPLPGPAGTSPSPSGSPVLQLRGPSPSRVVPQPSSTTRKRTRAEFESDDTPSLRRDCPLRRHKHYRMVVEEVGMPLSEIHGGRELIKVVQSCLRGHEDAINKAGILHRDINDGNLIILPRLVYDAEINIFAVVWNGLLVDWELSASIDDLKVEQRPCKCPNLVGTWQFLSAGMLSGDTNIPEIPDELESFFHVLLWNAVLYLQSNCPDHDAFLDRFFDGMDRDDRGCVTCGSAKRLTVKEGVGHPEIDVGAGVPLKFDTPLDDIFEELLRCFRARYKVQRWRKMQSESMNAAVQTPRVVPPQGGERSSSLPFPPTSASNQQLSPVRHPDSPSEEASEGPAQADKESKNLSSPYMPTPEEEKCATYVASHRYMDRILTMEIIEGRWGYDKKVRRVCSPWEEI